jgi:hypothetical protein
MQVFCVTFSARSEVMVTARLDDIVTAKPEVIFTARLVV